MSRQVHLSTQCCDPPERFWLGSGLHTGPPRCLGTGGTGLQPRSIDPPKCAPAHADSLLIGDILPAPRLTNTTPPDRTPASSVLYCWPVGPPDKTPPCCFRALSVLTVRVGNRRRKRSGARGREVRRQTTRRRGVQRDRGTGRVKYSLLLLLMLIWAAAPGPGGLFNADPVMCPQLPTLPIHQPSKSVATAQARPFGAKRKRR